MVRRHRDGFSLVELLVGLVIFTSLMAITLPAIQASRESARLSSCRGNLVQISKGMQQFEAYFRYYPSGGWSPQWVGVAERQGDASQPGGWSYSLLPYLEAKDARNTVAKVTAATAAAAYTRLATAPVPNFNCPTRRTAQSLAVTSTNATYQTGVGPVSITRATRGDYAVNSGSVESCPPLAKMAAAVTSAASGKGKAAKVTICHAPPGNPANGNTLSISISGLNGHMNHSGDRFGSCASCVQPIVADTPASLTVGDTWTKMSAADRMTTLADMGIPDVQNGLAGRMSTLRAAHVSDGLSNTYMVGEKNVATTSYFSGTDPGDTRPLTSGYSSSNVRWGYVPPAPDSAVANPAAFGSGHRAGWNMAYGDGMVRTISFSIDARLHANLSSRNDGPGVIAIPPE